MKAFFLLLLVFSLSSCMSLRGDSNVDLGKDRPLKPLKSGAPEYPVEAAMKGQSGYVKLLVDITKKGKPYNIRVVESKPKKVFDSAAKKAVRKYMYRPPVKSGKLSVVKDHKIEISFSLGEEL